MTKHERERYEVLKHIWTDTGRGRAWIRSSLNERSLERYITLYLEIKFLCIKLIRHIFLLNNNYEGQIHTVCLKSNTTIPDIKLC